ncbi:hypothetical protein [Caballeronia sordidicola]|uniref:Phage tail fiber protein n=1 Tax=Caballeronia sordidicola TaxID=196367 RepID=A0A242N787_CABSO|nr:hypothetical protein [Caballeronia sordidicola]OTP79501.1 Phage tail fiber protein [Caballeronia sordidicola]
MYRIDDPSASTTLPTPEAATAEGYWTEGNPGSGIPATLERASWFNMIQEELRAIVTAVGITPSKTTYNQVLTAIKTLISTQVATVSGVVGQSRNAKMSIGAVSATAAFNADEVIVETALGGVRYCLPSQGYSINLATVGAGGMDTGSAPASGFIALYAIFNPSSGVANIIGTNATAARAPEVYGGTHMPAGFTASALISVWPTNASGQFIIGTMTERKVRFAPSVQVLNFSGPQASLTPVSLANAIPKNAGAVTGFAQVGTTSAGNTTLIFSDSNGAGVNQFGYAAAQGNTFSFRQELAAAQTMNYSVGTSAGTLTTVINITGYDF